MAETKFTPGPWRRFTSSDGFTSVYADGTACYTEAEVGFALQGPRQIIAGVSSEEDGSLIAAAPELYEALERALGRINDLQIIINEARELGLTLFVCGDSYDPEQGAGALAKARGEA